MDENREHLRELEYINDEMIKPLIGGTIIEIGRAHV